MYPPPCTKTITGSDSLSGASGATTLSVRQSSPIGWDLPTPSTVYRRSWGAHLVSRGRVWRPKSPRADWRASVRDGAPPVHPVAGETFDGADGSRHADGVLMHHLTVANVKGPRSAGRVRGLGSPRWCRRPRSAPPAP